MSAAAAVLLTDGRGRVLFGRRSAAKASCPGFWDAPGGHLEPGETPEDALVREAREELDVELTAWVLLDTVAFPEDGLVLPCLVYAAVAWTGDPRRVGDEHDELRWFTPDELERLPDLASPAYPALARRAVLARGGGGDR